VSKEEIKSKIEALKKERRMLALQAFDDEEGIKQIEQEIAALERLLEGK
jgi:cell fate (sporulation/competence/biofilm development) regulator YmcA (YheA/YmcA/DUF963 family)